MKATLEERKQQAIKNLKKLGVYEGFIKDFEKDNNVCIYEHFMGYWAFQYPEIMEKIKAFEEKHNCTVYAVTHEFTEFGEIYDLMFVSSYKEEWDYDVENYEKKDFRVYAYAWNKTDEWCSDFGSILVRSHFGGLCRIA